MDTHKGLYALHQAAAEGNMPALRSLLAASYSRSSHTEIDARNRRGNTALMLAAETVQVEAVQVLLAAGANPLLFNQQRHVARDFCLKGSARRGSQPTASEAEIEKLLIEAERAAEAQGMMAAGPPGMAATSTLYAEQLSKPEQSSVPRQRVEDSARRCPVCGAAVRRRLKIDFLQEEDEKGELGLGECSLHVTTALHSRALQTMRGHPNLHYHNLLDMRSLRKEISESWGALAATRSLLAELNVDPADVVFFDLCSGKAMTAVALAMTFPQSTVIALDIISSKCLPHTSDLTNLRYAEANLFQAEGMLRKELDQQDRGGKYGLLIGSHLCGRLSSQAVALFQAIPQVAGVVLSPCCWPRRRDFNSDEELKELAVLLWAKAVSSDTYATWVLHLWGMLAGQHVLPSLTPPEGDTDQVGLWTGCGRNFVGSEIQSKNHKSELSAVPNLNLRTSSDNVAAELDESCLVQSATEGSSAVDAAESARTARVEHLNVSPEAQPLPWEETSRRGDVAIAPPQISIGLQRDPNILSEKNLILVAHKVPNHNRWTSNGLQRHHAAVASRYALTPAELAAQRYHSLCDVYGSSIGINKSTMSAAVNHPPSKERPPPPLDQRGQHTKEFRYYGKKAPHHRASRIVLHYLRQLGVPESLFKGAKGDPEKYADPSRIRKNANLRGAAGRGRRPAVPVEEQRATQTTVSADALSTDQ
eukprot:COSAG02_NODE_3481_length_6671_cov_12.360012_6_plen_704_part_00